MFKIFLLVLGCGLAAKLTKTLALRSQANKSNLDKREVQRWEHEGGSVIEPQRTRAL